jgi:hypothetical protein
MLAPGWQSPARLAIRRAAELAPRSGCLSRNGHAATHRVVRASARGRMARRAPSHRAAGVLPYSPSHHRRSVVRVSLGPVAPLVDPPAARLMIGQGTTSPFGLDVRHVRCRTMPTHGTRAKYAAVGKGAQAERHRRGCSGHARWPAPRARRWLEGAVDQALPARSPWTSRENGFRQRERRSHPPDLSPAVRSEHAKRSPSSLRVKRKDQQ